MQQLSADTLQLLTDSMVEAPVAEQPEISLFQGHALVAQDGFSVSELGVSDSGFIFFILLLCLSIAAYLQLNSDRLFTSIFKASFDRNLASQEARIENAQRIRNLIIVQTVAFLSISLFLTAVLSKIFLITTAYGLLFLQVLGGLFGAYLIKRFVFFLMTLVFEMGEAVRLHRNDLTLFLSSLGLLLLPVTLLFFYAPILPPPVPYYIGVGAIGFFYLKGLFRGVLLTVGTATVSPLHLFYYFCALEILPIFILVRFVQTL